MGIVGGSAWSPRTRMRTRKRAHTADNRNDNLLQVYMSEVTKPKFDEVNGFAKRHKEWVLETDGTNLMAALCAEQIDPQRTVSNDVVECCTVLGIEGARGSLLKEFR